MSFFYKNTDPTKLHTYSPALSLHYALPIFSTTGACATRGPSGVLAKTAAKPTSRTSSSARSSCRGRKAEFGCISSLWVDAPDASWRSAFCPRVSRSEAHTSELQSLLLHTYAVFCFKKKNIHNLKPHK